MDIFILPSDWMKEMKKDQTVRHTALMFNNWNRDLEVETRATWRTFQTQSKIKNHTQKNFLYFPKHFLILRGGC